MKKLFIIALLAVVNMVQAQYVIEMNDGSIVPWNYELNIIQNGTGDVWSLSRTDKFNNNLELSKVKSISIATMAERLAAYKTPNYIDDYRNNSGWDKRSSWNLANVHDPTVMRADDGYYYMYQTDASFGNVHNGNGHFHGRRSKNLIDWEFLGATMATVPSWVKDTLDASRTRLGLPLITKPQYGYWAPCARKVKSGLYRMYYCIVVDNYIKTGNPATEAFDGSWGERAFIGLMETDNPASNNWVDKGFVLSSMSDRGKNWGRNSTSDWEGYFRYNAIDPTFIITPEGEHWMIYGSWHSGFASVQLDPETGKTLNEMPEFFTTLGTLNSVVKRVYTRTANSRWQGSEGPEVIYRNGYYYMFLAYDGLTIPYNTRVVRSEKIDGPYFNIAGKNVTDGGDALPLMTHPYKFGNDHGWVGLSHCAVWDDGNDNWYYCSQGRYPENYDTWAPNAIMLGHVRSIRWTKDGWPIVMPERYAAVPQTPITEEDIVGTWEHIDMSYNYGNQKASSDMVFSADHKITSGTWKNGTWSFDPATNTLTANGVELLLQRECDWEANPRKHTIVYAGMTTSKTYWGKKK